MTVVSVKCVTLSDGVTFELPFSDLLPDLTPALYADLKESIAAEGILSPILVNEWNEVIDGQHRLLIAKELGIPSTQIHQQLTLPDDGSPRAEILARMRRLALISNIHRRQLSPETRAEFVAALKGEGLSNREIAGTLGVAEKTVRNDLAKCSGAENSAPEHPETVTGTDGKSYPARVSEDTIAERRERVATAKTEGKSHREIAKDLGVSVGTVAADLGAVAGGVLDTALEKVVPAADPEPETVTEDEAAGMDEEDLEAFSETVDRHRDRVKKHYGSDDSKETTKPTYPPRRGSSKSTNDVDKTKSSRVELKAVRQDSSDLWHVVDSAGELYGIIERGWPRGHTQSSFVASALIPWENHPLEAPLFHGMSSDGSYPTLKSVVEDIEKAVADPDSFWRSHESSKEFRNRCYITQDKDTYHGGAKSVPSEPFHDIDLDGEGWKQEEDLETSSLWIFKSRAKGQGRRGDYHGNFIPQVPDQFVRRYTQAGDVVVDLFAGSGTTAIEAKRLGRHFVGVDLNCGELGGRYEEIRQLPNPHNVTTKIFWGNSAGPFVYEKIQRHLRDEHSKDYADHVVLHPPYWDIIQFTPEYQSDKDLSQSKTLGEFLDRFEDVAWRALKLLRPRRFLTVVMGDTYRSGCWVPLGPYCMSRVMKMGLTRMKARNIKNVAGNEKGSGGSGARLQSWRAIRDGTSTFAFEEVMIFQKVSEI